MDMKAALLGLLGPAANLEAVKMLVAAGLVNAAGPDGQTVLMVSATGGFTDAVKYLVGRLDIDIDARSAEGLGHSTSPAKTAIWRRSSYW